MELYRPLNILLVFLGLSLGSCFAQQDDFAYLFPFVSKEYRLNNLYDWENGKNYSVITKLETGISYKHRVRAIALTGLNQTEIDGELLSIYTNLEVLYIQADLHNNYSVLSELSNQNLLEIANGLSMLKNLKYIKVIGSNDSLNHVLSNLNSLKSLIIYNSSNSFETEGSWNRLNYLKYMGKTHNMDLSKMFELDSISIGASDRSNPFASLPNNSIQTVSFYGDPRGLNYSVFNPKFLKLLRLDISVQSSSTEPIEIKLVGIDSLIELDILNTVPIKWSREVSLPNLKKLRIRTFGHLSGEYFPSEFPFFIKSLSKLKSLELDLYTDYIPNKRDFPRELSQVKLRLRRKTDIKKINFLRKLKKLSHLELALYPLETGDSNYMTLELKGDYWLLRVKNKLALSLRNGTQLKHFQKIIDGGGVSRLSMETLQVRENIDILCSNNFEEVHIYTSQILNSSNQFKLVRLTDEEIERIVQCLEGSLMSYW